MWGDLVSRNSNIFRMLAIFLIACCGVCGYKSMAALPLDLKQIEQDEVLGFQFSEDKKTLLKSPSDVTTYSIPQGVTQIGREAFNHCTKLSHIVIPNSVTRIGFDAFGRCASLKKVVIPDSVLEIDQGAFVDCVNLTEVVMGKNVKRISLYVFSGCSSLAEVFISASTTQIGKGAFYLVRSLRVDPAKDVLPCH